MQPSNSESSSDPSSENGCVHPGMSHATAVARRQVEILNRLGLHLRAADQFVRLARRFQCEIRVHYQGNASNGKSILELTTLAAECGTRLDLEACGPDAVAAVEAPAVVVAARFYENENETEHIRMTSDTSQVIVTTEDYLLRSVHDRPSTIGTFPRSGAKAARLRMPPLAWSSCCPGLSTVHRATGAGSTSSVPSRMFGRS